MPLAAQSIELILDSSRSMNAPFEGATTRIAAARTAVAQLLATAKTETPIAFHTHGGKCGWALAVTAVPEAVAAEGQTSLEAALRAASARTVILVSDGKETCEGNPCAAARALREANPDLVVHTVGVGVDAAGRSELQCIARMTGGTYFDATTAQQLATALATALNTPAQALPPPAMETGYLLMTEADSHKVFDATRKEVAVLTPAQKTVALPSGIYSVSFGELRWGGIEIRGPETTVISPATIRIENLTGSAQIIEPETGEVVATGSTALVLPGTYDVRIGKAEWPNVRADAGKRVTLSLATIQVHNMPMTASATITDAKGTTLTSINAINTTAGLPPGEYVIRMPGRPQRVTLQAGQVLELRVEPQ